MSRNVETSVKAPPSERSPLVTNSNTAMAQTTQSTAEHDAVISEKPEEVERPSTSRADSPKRHIWHGVLVAILMGFIFGFAFEKSRVFEPENIRNQFLFRKWLMLKMFLAAMAASATVLLVACQFFNESFQFIREAFHGCYHRGIFTAIALGSFMLGSGMAIGGGCPGMVAAQLGSGVDTAYATFIGALVGALAFGFLEPMLNKWIDIGPKFTKFHLDDATPIPYWVIVVGQLVFSVAVIIVLEVLEPWDEETTFPNQEGCGVFGCKSWPPWASGIFVGLLQAPAVLIVRDTLGSSTAYGTVCSLTTHALKEEQRETYFKRFASLRLGWENWWQVLYLASAILGALASAGSSNTLGDVDGIAPAAGFIGGFLMLFGSRLAGGCTSGHGISGFTLANLSSFVAVPCMFAGGIATAFIYEAADSNFP